jgi:hypothetical protein
MLSFGVCPDHATDSVALARQQEVQRKHDRQERERKRPQSFAPPSRKKKGAKLRRKIPSRKEACDEVPTL